MRKYKFSILMFLVVNNNSKENFTQLPIVSNSSEIMFFSVRVVMEISFWFSYKRDLDNQVI